MSRSHQAIAVLLVALFGLWGCSKAPTDGGLSAEKLKTVETKLAKLEDDFRAASSARDQLRKKLSQAEETQAELQAQTERLAKDVKIKDELIERRTSERDQTVSQYEGFRKGLKELISKAEESMAKSDAPASPAVPATPTSLTKPSELPVVPELPLPK
ncbi:hypothetical protein [Zavarzinella formosa]|uniref:hypothetical protein n=1 Tax=Zavarzinella formosa TaxID=360055 RepID=UPI000300DADE|nr:hypothetical protein [Zavarzinella formosa]